MNSLHPTAAACGKVILVGEHAAVYGFPALAAGLPGALSLRAAPEPERIAVRVRIPAWSIDVRLDDDHPVARACAEVLAFCGGPQVGWTIDGETSLPARAGLGSSAALTVAVARLALGPNADPKTLLEASLCGERVFHGDPSGIDSEVAARGGMLRFVRGQPVESLPLLRPLSLCLVPSGVPRSTADQVAKVRTRRDRFPTLAEPMLASLGAAVPEAITAINNGDLARLGEIFDIAHGLLGALDVSSPALDELCARARAAGAHGAKLTGAGGGGCIVCVPPTAPQALVSAFTARGLEPVVVTLQASESNP